MTCSKSQCIRGWARTPGEAWLGVAVGDSAALRHGGMAHGIQQTLPTFSDSGASP